MIQSESRVWPAFVARRKSVTRRDWTEKTANWYRKGRVFDAYDKVPFHGGKKIGEARCTCDAYQEPLREMPDDHWDREGFAYLNEHPLAIPAKAIADRLIWTAGECSERAFRAWRAREADVVYWVCEFEIVSVEDWAVDRLANILLSDGAIKA